MPPYQSPQPPYQPPQLPNPPQPGPSGQSPSQYDFIMQGGNQPKPTLGLGSNGQPNKLIIIAAAVIALIILIVLGSLLFKGKGADPTLVKITQEQTEIARVAGYQGSDDSGGDLTLDETTKALAINTQLSMLSANADFVTYLGQNGIKVSEDQMAAGANSQTDAKLADAQTNGTLDTTLTEVLSQELKQYQQTLNQAYNSASSAESKDRLQTLYDQADLLIDQAQ